MFTVTLTACVAGNPLKAWRGGSDPDDRWQDQTHEFADLDAAKAFIEGLPGSRKDDHGVLFSGETVTHVVLTSQGTGPDGADEVLYVQDAGTDDLDAAEPGVVPVSQRPPEVPEEDTILEAPPLMAAQ